jgi:hypothetical protein
VESIELVELDLEPVLVKLEAVFGQSRVGNTAILLVFGSFLAFSEGKRGLMEKVNRRIDRARRARAGTSVR